MSLQNQYSSVRINARATDRLDAGHLWVFVSDLIDASKAVPGDVVRVLDPKGRTLGRAHYSSSSQIALRLLSRTLEPIDASFFERRIANAQVFRQGIVHQSDAYRLVHAEGDLLPGLVIDRYAQWLVLQLLDQGMDRMSSLVIEALQKVISPTGILGRNDVASRAKENLPQEIKLLTGQVPEQIPIHMNGLRWQVNAWSGQKTGIFLDQRENYLAAAKYAKGRALDCFGGTGGFGLHLSRVCESVELVDSSAESIESAQKNAALNDLTNLQFHKSDALDYLAAVTHSKRKFDIAVVDPPAFTKSRSAKDGALRGYKEINLRALRLLNAGGILVSCSCSHHVSEADLLELIADAALDSGKQLRVLERRTQAQDHPILLTVPETHYLKCLIFQVLG